MGTDRTTKGIILVYDVSNRETFDALPRWYNELETYVSPNVVKILVGNKLDKVSVLFSSYLFVQNSSDICIQEFSRAVTNAEGEKFAKQMGSLFIEASAKTNVGVREAFLDLVEKVSRFAPFIVTPSHHIFAKKILDTPALWAPVSPAIGTRTGTGKSQRMPGQIDLSSQAADDDKGGCGC